MKSLKVDYEKVEAALTKAGIAFSSPTAGHYRIFIRATARAIYYPKSGKVAIQLLGEPEKILSLSPGTSADYNRDIKKLGQIVADLKKFEPLPEELKNTTPQPTFRATSLS